MRMSPGVVMMGLMGWGRLVAGPKTRMAGGNDAGLVERATPKTKKPETRARERLTVFAQPQSTKPLILYTSLDKQQLAQMLLHMYDLLPLLEIDFSQNEGSFVTSKAVATCSKLYICIVTCSEIDQHQHRIHTYLTPSSFRKIAKSQQSRPLR